MLSIIAFVWRQRQRQAKRDDARIMRVKNRLFELLYALTAIGLNHLSFDILLFQSFPLDVCR